MNLAEAIPFLGAQKVAMRPRYGSQLPMLVLLGRFEYLLLCRSHLSLLEVFKIFKGNKLKKYEVREIMRVKMGFKLKNELDGWFRTATIMSLF